MFLNDERGSLGGIFALLFTVDSLLLVVGLPILSGFNAVLLFLLIFVGFNLLFLGAVAFLNSNGD